MKRSKDAPSPADELDRLSAFARRALHRWRLALIVLLVGELSCLIYILLRKPTYRSQTVLLYAETVRAAETGEPAMAPKNVALRMQELLNSRRELGQVVDEFDLYPEVREAYGPLDAVAELRKHVEFRAPGGDTFSIAFEGRSPLEARDVTRRLAELLVSQDAELRRKQAVAARDFLAEEKQRGAQRLKDAEQDLAGFMAVHPSFALDTTPLATGAAIRASVAKPAAGGSAGARRVIAVPAPKTEPSATSAPAPAAPSPAELRRARDANEEVARAGAAVEAARQVVSEKRERYTDAHPDVRAAREALGRAEARLGLARRALPSVRAEPAPAPAVEPKAAPRRYVTLPVKPGQEPPAEAKTEDLVLMETDWARLTRAVTEARQRHDQVEAALFKADIASSSASGGRGAETTVIDPAYLPQRPVPPGPRTIALLFFAASALSAFAAAIGAAALDDRIYDAGGAEGLLEVLADVPRAGAGRGAHA